MIKKSLFALFLLSLGSAAVAEEQSKFYVEASYGGIKYSQYGYYATPGVGILKFGANINKNLSVEGQVGTTITNATGYIGVTPVSVKYDSIYGVFLKAKAEVTPDFEVFGRLGYAHASISVSTPYGSGSAENGDFAYGIGAQYNFTPVVYGQIDYMSYYNKNGATANGPSIGLGLKF